MAQGARARRLRAAGAGCWSGGVRVTIPGRGQGWAAISLAERLGRGSSVSVYVRIGGHVYIGTRYLCPESPQQIEVVYRAAMEEAVASMPRLPEWREE